ncbi:MAG: right-handed parallel beta-helix repeat-containing protein [Verrucomicrobiae bacterium]|nr:right-handed parallel beta-helix repeat-containing protein [Verrucomicrobiae bacterium]
MKRHILFLGALCVHLPSVAPAVAETQGACVVLRFDGDTRDASGRGNDAVGEGARFVPGHEGRALSTGTGAVVVPDCGDVRLAPGLRIECWVRLDALPPEGQEILSKDDEYILRVDPAREGGRFSFFVNLGGWEARASAKAAPVPGRWHRLVAAWDGKLLSLEVDGQVARTPRAGTPEVSGEPLRIGPIEGAIDELRIVNPAGNRSAAAHWPFDGGVADASGKGHDGVAKDATFVPGRCGQAIRLGREPVSIPDSPELQLSAGLRIDCSVRVDALPANYQHIVMKDGEYQLRLNSTKEGSRFAFFVFLDGKWEPRAESVGPARPGAWHRISARWDGSALTLDVDGQRERASRSGMPSPKGQPLRLGAPGIALDEVCIVNPRRPLLRARALEQRQAILRAGRPEIIAATVRNLGAEAQEAVATLEVPGTVACLTPAARPLGTLAPGAAARVEWTLRAGSETTATAGIRLAARGLKPAADRFTLSFFPEADRAPLAPPPRPEGAAPGVTYHVDPSRGDNANAGTSPEAPWRDFTPANGRTLGPGDRLLIRRGGVINQELDISARGTAAHWAEIGAYGEGPRPIIRRNWDIDDRCALVRDPDFLKISGLVFSHAGKGLVVHYRGGGHAGLLVEDCIAHDIEGLYRFNAHGIPEWRDRIGAPDDGLRSSAGFAFTGAPAKDITLRDCEMFHCSWGFFARGEALTVDRVFCHDNFVHNTSPHPAIVGARRSILQNSIFDAPGWHAYAGTMGIMLVDPQGLIIRNCTFRNQPDSGSHDEGGIDFENTGSGCLIDRCTFQNNAGAAIEMLGLRAPQTRNVEIANSRFILNNVASKLGPSEIYIWGKAPDPEVCCSTGWIRDNGYVLNPGVAFFTNEAPATTRWTLANNTAYPTVAALKAAMPFNDPPVVQAGPDRHTAEATLVLEGKVSDDGRPAGRSLAVRWELLDGPANVAFENARAPRTAATFPARGAYTLRLVADDGELWLSDTVVVHRLAESASVARAWEFNTPLDKEGWTEVNPGTKVQEWLDQQWPCKAEPVKYVGGGFYILAIENSRDAHLLSPDNLGIALPAAGVVHLRFQNHTPARQMRLRFTTDQDAAWDERKATIFEVSPNDNAPREYAVDMRRAPGWKGQLKQLRLDIATGTPLTGTCRFDSIRIEINTQ